ncbi:type II toxin-antitoxin system MqsA family antitoxin [Negativibacillus massiliensis]|uniref:type II toxin-antitoxin system MqsA family antitoxin n=1 Tax=Negativibacillus massiliensis TaxID=1871035 RepID=UPI003AF446DC
MCFYCKCKTTKPSRATHVVTFDDCIIVVKNVPCEECEQCGEKYFSDEVMEQLEIIVAKARQLASEVFVVDYNKRVA